MRYLQYLCTTDWRPSPALLPMIGIMAKYPRSDDYDPKSPAADLYLHGYISSRLMRLAAKCADASANDPNAPEGLPLTVSATIVDGIVLSLTPNSHSYNYRSAVLQGYGVPVSDEAEKVWAMRAITDKVVPQRWENSRIPPTRAEMGSTCILRVSVVSASGKCRRGGPHDDRFDLEDEEVTGRVWTGVMPVWEVRGEVVRAEGEIKNVPGYIEDARVRANGEREGAAFDAAKEE